MDKKGGWIPGVGIRSFDEGGNVTGAVGDLSGLEFGGKQLPKGSAGVYSRVDLTGRQPFKVFDSETETIVLMYDNRDTESGVEFLVHTEGRWQWLPSDRFKPVVTESREGRPIFP